MPLMSKIGFGNVLADPKMFVGGVALACVPVLRGVVLLKKYFGEVGDQNISSLLRLLSVYRTMDFDGFMKSHRDAYKRGKETGDFVPGVCNYYSVMSRVITMASGPFWHFVPMLSGLSRMQSHHEFHRTVRKFLQAKDTDKIVEIGCGYGEMGRQIASLSGASVTGLTMADEEIAGGNERIKAAGLQKQCRMVQGDYHNLPFEANTMDKVFGIYTLKYSSDLDLAISEAARVLKPGGRFLSYEILVTDRYDPEQTLQKYYVENISSSTCMPPLWHAKDFREAAKKAGLVPSDDVDLCGPSRGAGQWYSCFERTGVYFLLSSPVLKQLVSIAEKLRILPRSFTDWFEHCIVHPTTDFVNAGRMGIVSGAVMMTWTKP